MSTVMLSVGSFSRISRVAIQALRYYDKIGLFKPAFVDHPSGYRYYTIDQLPQLHRIVALKTLGLSLEQVARLLEHNVAIEEIQAMLRRRKAQLAGQMCEVQMQLAQIEARLEHIDRAGAVPGYDIVLKVLDPVLVAGRRIIVPKNIDHPIGLPEAFTEVYRYTTERRADIIGADIAIWYTPADATANEDVEAALQLKLPIRGNERIAVHELPPVHAASVIHTGAFKDFAQAYTTILAWITANSYQVAGPFREIYHRWQRDHLEDVVVEVLFPVAPA